MFQDPFYYAVERGDEAATLSYLESPYPELDVGSLNRERQAPLHHAVNHGMHKVVALLLRHPDINVNPINEFGETPFLWAMIFGDIACLRLLLQDPRVDVNCRDSFRRTPLRQAVYFGSMENLKWWIVSGREMDLGEPGNPDNDAIWVGRNRALGYWEESVEEFEENMRE